TLSDIEGVEYEHLGIVSDDGNRQIHHDKRVHLIPDAKLLVTIPSTDDKLIVRRFDLDAFLAKSPVNYLFVSSQPPSNGVRGETYRYTMTVKSKKGGVKLKLESSPKGMSLSEDGKLTWPISKDFSDGEADVIISVRDESGQEVLQTFKVEVR